MQSERAYLTMMCDKHKNHLTELQGTCDELKEITNRKLDVDKFEDFKFLESARELDLADRVRRVDQAHASHLEAHDTLKACLLALEQRHIDAVRVTDQKLSDLQRMADEFSKNEWRPAPPEESSLTDLHRPPEHPHPQPTGGGVRMSFTEGTRARTAAQASTNMMSSQITALQDAMTRKADKHILERLDTKLEHLTQLMGGLCTIEVTDRLARELNHIKEQQCTLEEIVQEGKSSLGEIRQKASVDASETKAKLATIKAQIDDKADRRQVKDLHLENQATRAQVAALDQELKKQKRLPTNE